MLNNIYKIKLIYTIIIFKQLKKIIYQKNFNKYSKTGLDKKYPGLYDLIQSSFGESDQEKRYCLVNQIQSNPICRNENCNNKVKFKRYKNSYGKFCCQRCAVTSKSIRIKMVKSYMTKYGNNDIDDNHVMNDLDYKIDFSKLSFNRSDTYRIPNKDDLVYLYHDLKMPYVVISRMVSMNNVTVKSRLVKYGIAIRTHSEQQRLHNIKYDDSSFKDPEVQKKALETRKLTDSSIALAKRIKTVKQKYGEQYKNVFQVPSIFENIKIKYPSNGNSTSKGEIELGDYIESLGYDIRRNDRILICPLEVDILIPKLNIAFEFNGDYWHMNPAIYESSDFNKMVNKSAEQIWNRDIKKIELCKDKAVDLYHVWESDWNNNQEEIKSLIRSIFKSSL